MTVLGCSIHNCVNNEAGLCGARTIRVNGEGAYTSELTFCENFMEETVINAAKAIPNTNFAGELAQIFSSDYEIKMSPEILCSAESCFYNGEGRCEARNIMIVTNELGKDKETQCETFIESY